MSEIVKNLQFIRERIIYASSKRAQVNYQFSKIFEFF